MSDCRMSMKHRPAPLMDEDAERLRALGYLEGQGVED